MWKRSFLKTQFIESAKAWKLVFTKHESVKCNFTKHESAKLVLLKTQTSENTKVQNYVLLNLVVRLARGERLNNCNARDLLASRERVVRLQLRSSNRMYKNTRALIYFRLVARWAIANRRKRICSRNKKTNVFFPLASTLIQVKVKKKRTREQTWLCD